MVRGIIVFLREGKGEADLRHLNLEHQILKLCGGAEKVLARQLEKDFRLL
jgi:hypothetical protein